MASGFQCTLRAGAPPYRHEGETRGDERRRAEGLGDVAAAALSSAESLLVVCGASHSATSLSTD